MQYKKTRPENLINLQAGKYAHITDEAIVINDVLTLEPYHMVNTINKSSDWRTLRLIINALFTIGVITAAVYLGFYPLALLIFVAVWDLRQIKRYNLPVNSSLLIPFKNIESARLQKGTIGFYYIDLIIVDDNGKKSLKPLKLYDSASTVQHAVNIFKKLGYLKTSFDPNHKEIEGEVFIIDEANAYVKDGDFLHFTYNGKYNKERKDPYQYFRIIAVIAFFIGVLAVVSKIHSMYFDPDKFFVKPVDYVVVILLVLLTYLPVRLLRKGLPNKVYKKDILSVTQKKNHILLKIKGFLGIPFSIKMRSAGKEGLLNFKNS